jgi:hypothetical protein
MGDTGMATKMTLPGMGLMKGVGLGPLNIGNVLDTMGFVKKAWGAMNAPSAFMPTIDVEELQKRIVDLQAVEQWLVMNLGMIQGSIQALEVQKATIETLKGVTKGLIPGLGSETSQNPAMSPEAIASTLFNAPSFDFSKTPTSNVAAAVSVAPEPKAKRKAAALPVSSKAGDSALGPTSWLEFLQSQFNQVTQAAMSGASLKSAQKTARSVVKSASKSLPKKVATKSGAKKTRSSK